MSPKPLAELLGNPHAAPPHALAVPYLGRVTDVNFQLEKGRRYLLRVGSKNRRFAYVVVGPAV